MKQFKNDAQEASKEWQSIKKAIDKYHPDLPASLCRDISEWGVKVGSLLEEERTVKDVYGRRDYKDSAAHILGVDIQDFIKYYDIRVEKRYKDDGNDSIAQPDRYTSPLLMYISSDSLLEAKDAFQFYTWDLTFTPLATMVLQNIKRHSDMAEYIESAYVTFKDQDILLFVKKVRDALRRDASPVDTARQEEALYMAFTCLFKMTSKIALISLAKDISREEPQALDSADVGVAQSTRILNRLEYLSDAVAFYNELEACTNARVVADQPSLTQDWMKERLLTGSEGLVGAEVRPVLSSNRLEHVRRSSQEGSYMFKEYIGGEYRYRNVKYETEKEITERNDYEKMKIKLSQGGEVANDQVLQKLRSDALFRSDRGGTELSLYISAKIISSNGWDHTKDVTTCKIEEKEHKTTEAKTIGGYLLDRGKLDQTVLTVMSTSKLRWSLSLQNSAETGTEVGRTDWVSVKAIRDKKMESCYYCKNNVNKNSCIITIQNLTV